MSPKVDREIFPAAWYRLTMSKNLEAGMRAGRFDLDPSFFPRYGSFHSGKQFIFSS